MSEAVENVVESSEPVETVEAVESTEAIETTEEMAGTEEVSQGAEVESETVEELQEEVEQAIEDGASEEEVQNMIRKFELKVNGKTIEKEIDLSDEDAIRRELQLAAAGRNSMQETAELKKYYTNVLREAQDNPLKFLQDIGVDPDEWAEKRIQSKIEELKKTPEQIERENLERELENARKELAEKKEAEEQARMEKLEQEEAQQLNDEIIEALNAHPTLPPTQKTMSRIAGALLQSMDYAEENGYDPMSISVADVIPHVEQEMRAEMRELLDAAPINMLEEIVGKNKLEEYRNSRIKEIKNPTQTKDIKPTAASVKTNENKEERKPVKSRDFFRNLHKQFKS